MNMVFLSENDCTSLLLNIYLQEN